MPVKGTPIRTEKPPSKRSTPLSIKRKMSSSEMGEIRGRTDELAAIRNFIQECVDSRTAGIMFISGKPGTGKTACVQKIFSAHKGEKCLKNCMTLSDNGKTLYQEMMQLMIEGDNTAASARTQSRVTRSAATPSKKAQGPGDLEMILTDPRKPMKLVVLDEIDLISDKSALRRIFGWAAFEGSRIIMIGISNRLDLANQLNLESVAKIKRTLHFSPYSVQQIKEILHDRVNEAEDKDLVSLDQGAIELCAKKIAASSGDIRNALDVLRWGIQTAEKHKRARQNTEEENPISQDDLLEVKPFHVLSTFLEESKIRSTLSLTLQQRVMICCALILKRKVSRITVGMLWDKYRDLLPGGVRPSDGDIASVLDLLVGSGVLAIHGKQKGSRLSEVVLKISEEEAENELAGKPLMNSLLSK